MRKLPIEMRWKYRSKLLTTKFLFPLSLPFSVLLLTILNVSGSSVGLYETSIGESYDNAGVLFGEVRPFRSDEWLVRTPWLVSQAENGFPQFVNNGMGSHDVSVVGDIPSRSLDVLVKPHHVPLLLLSPDRVVAAEWWMWHALMILGVFALVKSITKRDGIAACAGLLLAVAPSTQWWLAPGTFTTVGYGSLFAAFVIYATQQKQMRNSILYSTLAGWMLACLAATLYVPWVITTLIVVVPILLGVVVNQLYCSIERAQLLKNLGISFGIGALVFVVLIISFVLRHSEAISIVTQTVYPGQRTAETAGGASRVSLFGAPFDYLAYENQMVVVNGTNPSENSSGVIYLVPITVACVFYLLFKKFSLRNVIDVALLCSIFAGLVLLAWATVPLPSWVGQLLLLNRVPPVRIAPAAAFGSVICLALFLSKPNLLSRLLKYVQAFFAIGAFLLILIWVSHNYVVSGTVINATKQAFIIGIVCLSLFTVFTRYFRVGLTGLLVFGVIQFSQINPIQRSVRPLTANSLATVIQSVNNQFEDSSGWLVLNGDAYVRGTVEASGVRYVSGISRYPDYEYWEILDPAKQYEESWNRYGHVHVAAGSAGSSPVITAPFPDVIQVVIDPCDKRLALLEVDVVVTQDLTLQSCGSLMRTLLWGERTIRMYRL